MDLLLQMHQNMDFFRQSSKWNNGQGNEPEATGVAFFLYIFINTLSDISLLCEFFMYLLF